VIADPNIRIMRIGKELPAEACLGEFVGIARFAGSVCAALVDSLVNSTRRLRIAISISSPPSTLFSAQTS